MEETTFAERLAMALARDGRTQGDVATAAGVPPDQLSRWKGGTVPDLGSVKALVLTLGVNGHWLLTGEGDMELRDPEKDAVWVNVIGRIVGDEIDLGTLRQLADGDLLAREAREVQKKLKDERGDGGNRRTSGGAA